MVQAIPKKLRSGDWGAKVEGSVRQGDTVEIVTRAGKRWTARVAKVVWQGDGIAIVATSSGQSERRAPSRGEHRCKNGHDPHPGPCCSGRHRMGDDCGADCCELD